MRRALGQRPRAVLFDAVGTLIHPHPPAAVAYHQVALRHGVDVPEELVAARFAEALANTVWAGPTDLATERRRWQAIVAGVFGEATTAALFDDLWAHFAASGNWRLYDDVAATWYHLEQRGFTLGVASNFDRRLLRIAEQIDPLSRATCVLCSAELGFSKPSIEFFRRAEAELGIAGEAILLVGDNLEHDVRAARRAGWQAIHLDRRGAHSCRESVSTLALLSNLLG